MIKEQIVRIETDGDETKAEVVGEIVRCKECKWWDSDYECCVDLSTQDKNGFCSWGERREDADSQGK